MFFRKACCWTSPTSSICSATKRAGPRILGELRDRAGSFVPPWPPRPVQRGRWRGTGEEDEGRRREGEKGRGGEREEGRGGEGRGETSGENSFLLPPFLLPLEALRLPEPIVALLHSLGVWRIEQLAALAAAGAFLRFGPELLDCLDRVTGRLPEPLPAWDPPQQFEVRWSAAEINEDWPTARRETIESALEHLVRRLAAMLTRAGRGAMRLECLRHCARAGPRSGSAVRDGRAVSPLGLGEPSRRSC